MSHSSSPTILQHHKKLLRLKSISSFQLKKIQYFQIRFVLKLAFLKRYFSNINYHNSVSRKMYCICIPKKKIGIFFKVDNKGGKKGALLPVQFVAIFLSYWISKFKYIRIHIIYKARTILKEGQ